ncbi:MAG TPA: hypothetical protein VHX37_06815 [Acidobacteriaceae bacterium]|jgi:hypothetical protein|nr:hypothetical protein [Acidobacteriaceae bacterium]
MPPKETTAEKAAAQQQEATAPAPQQQVLSIRVNEALRYRLEHLKRVHLAKTGESLSTSEVARLLLESARDDRLEFVKLAAEPMKSLLNARRKLDSRLPLSQLEWTLIAYYCQLGAEAFEDSMPNQISGESLAGILEAFLAVYGDDTKQTPTDLRYIANLPIDEEIGKKRAIDIGCEDVRYLTKKTIQALRNPTPLQRKPLLAGRNLFTVLDNTVFPSQELLNEALLPHWPILWRVCARGFYFHNSKPLVDEVPGKEAYEHFVGPPLPMFEESECSVVLPRGRHGDFALCLYFPGKLAPIFPMFQFVMICEFRAMMERFEPEQEESYWRGYYFSAYTSKMRSSKTVVTLRLNENGITFHLDCGAWQTFRNLLRRAWEHPEVRHLWSDMVLRYGEF